ncbi:helix-turn-helix domain-containing protein [Streptomyces spinoverrucosus]|uniref:helix-turn-helix transcriptional regulator n=1 Tax=Streptomyces spinoverrucosus TaxID=284043 RepID=UPI0018C41F73|nr:helix-turn-helix domain-containing protein [Streptomyces spinoverrucosus]MBG0857611.1 helix-turn-helix domain-containing protein [Streptomyces spinoverrucosus]
MTLDEASLTALAALGDELRRRMFEFVRTEHRPVTREEVAAQVGISRKLAAFHLDKLVTAGLLQAHYAPPAGIRKVGRWPKTYVPAVCGITVSIPERRYEMLADILTEAVVTEAPGERAHQSALRIAADRGRAVGTAERERMRPGRLGAERGLSLAAETLERFGYEPQRAAAMLVRLRNCPFHPLAAKAPELVCGINCAFLAGYLEGLGSDNTTAVLAPTPGMCCVELRGVGHQDRPAQGDAACGR